MEISDSLSIFVYPKAPLDKQLIKIKKIIARMSLLSMIFHVSSISPSNIEFSASRYASFSSSSVTFLQGICRRLILGVVLPYDSPILVGGVPYLAAEHRAVPYEVDFPR